MPRGYRLFIIALVGWLALGASLHTEDKHGPKQAVQSQAASNVAEAAPATIPSPQPKTNQPPSQNCKGTDKPELSCDAISAQAAIDQARDAHRQILIGWAQAGGLVLSLLFSAAATIAAFKAVREAEKGAQASRDSVIEAKRSANAAHQANRPWLSFDAPDIIYMQIADTISPERNFREVAFRTPLSVTNFGNSPAIRPRICHAIVGMKEFPDQKRIGIIENLKCGILGARIEPVYQNKPKVIFKDHIHWIGGPPDLTRENLADYRLMVYVGYEAIDGDFYVVGNTFNLAGIDPQEDRELFPVKIYQTFGGKEAFVT